MKHCGNVYRYVIPYVGKFWRTNGSKVFGEEKFGESVGSLLKTLAFINIGGENFGKLPTVHQIHQNFPTYGIVMIIVFIMSRLMPSSPKKGSGYDGRSKKCIGQLGDMYRIKRQCRKQQSSFVPCRSKLPVNQD